MTLQQHAKRLAMVPAILVGGAFLLVLWVACGVFAAIGLLIRLVVGPAEGDPEFPSTASH